MLAERTKKSGQSESAVVVPGSLVGCAAYLSSTKTRAVVTAAEPCRLVAFGPHELERLLVSAAITLASAAMTLVSVAITLAVSQKVKACLVMLCCKS